MSIFPFDRHWIVVLLVIALLGGCSVIPPQDSTEQIFRGEAEFARLEAAIRQSPLAGACPQPSIDQISYRYRDFPAEQELGRKSYVVVERQRGITGLAMTSSGQKPEGPFGTHDWPSSSARILSCGGLFTLAFREQHAPPGTNPQLKVGLAKPVAYDGNLPNRRYEVKRIAGYSGELFPLKSGNELVFSSAALVQSRSNRDGSTTSKLHDRVTYRVLGVSDTLVVSGVTVPGRVYLIEHVVQREGVGVLRKRDYYYSEALGWVIREVNYDNGSPVSVIDLTGWNGSDLL